MKKSIRILMPIFVTILCAGILLLVGIRPYEMVQTWIKVAFMDSSATVSTTGTAGLNIQETDIDTDYSGETSESGETVIPDYGSEYAILEAKSIDLYVPIYWGSGEELLDTGACFSPSSKPFGEDGNSVVSAHVNTFFHDLMQLQEGDTVTVYTSYGKFTYTVSQQIAFTSSQTSWVKPSTEDNRLTLYTCEMNLFGSSDNRVGWICALTDSAYYTTEEGTTDGE